MPVLYECVLFLASVINYNHNVMPQFGASLIVVNYAPRVIINGSNTFVIQAIGFVFRVSTMKKPKGQNCQSLTLQS